MAIASPRINQYLQKLNKKLQGEYDNFFYIFRGHPSDKFELNCTAFRHNDDRKNKIHLLDDQKKLIADFKMKGFDYSKEKQRRLNDIELLADMRHYGSPSCLIDFTSDFMIALWFACYEKPEKKGEIFILNCYETDAFLRVTPKDIEENIDHFIDTKSNHLWYWIPERFNQRLTDQDAVFVLGENIIPKERYQSIIVEKDDKKIILDELEKFFDYSKSTLFSDKYAIAENYKEKMKVKEEFLFDQSVYYIQTKEFQKAKNLLDIIISQDDLKKKNKKLSLEAHFQRAYSCINLLREKIKKNQLKDNLEKEIREHINVLRLRQSIDGLGYKEDFLYIEDFQVCIKNNYKKAKIKDMKDNLLKGLLGSSIQVEPYYCGITTDPNRRKEEHQKKYPNLSNWTQQSFSSRNEAQNWENQQTGCTHHPGGREPDNPNATWYGYRFSY